MKKFIVAGILLSLIGCMKTSSADEYHRYYNSEHRVYDTYHRNFITHMKYVRHNDHCRDGYRMNNLAGIAAGMIIIGVTADIIRREPKPRVIYVEPPQEQNVTINNNNNYYYYGE